MVNINPRYSLVLVLQLFLLGVDIFCNSFTILFGSNAIVLLVLYMVQDISLMFSLILLFLVFFNTFVFKAGLISLLIRKFSAPLIIGALYLVLTFAYHVWNLSIRWGRPNQYHWSNGLQAMYVFQKLLAVVYYYFYKRAVLKLGDTKYYEDSVWLRKHLSVRWWCQSSLCQLLLFHYSFCWFYHALTNYWSTAIMIRYFWGTGIIMDVQVHGHIYWPHWNVSKGNVN